jgi:hypothetical protein
VPAVAEEFRQILHDWSVRGIVVSWPVQPEGWCGASCGGVLFALDGLNSYGVLSGGTSSKAPAPPLCLWDQVHHDAPYEDEWGRCEHYSTVSTRTVHYASREQYDVHPEAFSAAGVWLDFCRAHWPEYCTYYGSALGSGTLTCRRNLPASLLARSAAPVAHRPLSASSVRKQAWVPLKASDGKHPTLLHKK